MNPTKHHPLARVLRRLPLLTALLLSAPVTWADSEGDSGKAAPAPDRDKSGYTLFNPTPRDAMREFSSDRPDQTESPFTVDAGHVQFDCGCNFGVSKGADDVNPFVGVTVRF